MERNLGLIAEEKLMATTLNKNSTINRTRELEKHHSHTHCHDISLGKDTCLLVVKHEVDSQLSGSA